MTFISLQLTCGLLKAIESKRPEAKAEYTCVIPPSYLASKEWIVTWGMIFFSIASWNKGGGGKSMARKRNGETEVLDSKQNKIICQLLANKIIYLIVVPRSMSNLGFSFCRESDRIMTCWVSNRSSPLNVLKMMPIHH